MRIRHLHAGHSCGSTPTDVVLSKLTVSKFAATKALKQKVGQRCGIIGLIIALGTLFSDTCLSNVEFKEAFESNAQWTSLVMSGGPLEQLKAEQTGGLGGGRPATMGSDTMFDEATNSGKEVSRVMLGIRDLSYMHQSQNLAAAMH